jgi:hypothetical protein
LQLARLAPVPVVPSAWPSARVLAAPVALFLCLRVRQALSMELVARFPSRVVKVVLLVAAL